ncbi:hypothetical protein [Serratia sp. 2723]|uniref:hypothetical protein n=1 Tax=unclassified Serratia (in: enterobacteria) TaxID=2647522 RepID=UPI003D20F484
MLRRAVIKHGGAYRNGTSITKLLSRYPPIFRTAISKLPNHDGRAAKLGLRQSVPDISPLSTMIYNVRILAVAQLATSAK